MNRELPPGERFRRQEHENTRLAIQAQKSLPLVYNKVRHDLLGKGSALEWSGDPTISLSSTNFLPPVAPTEKAYKSLIEQRENKTTTTEIKLDNDIDNNNKGELFSYQLT